MGMSVSWHRDGAFLRIWLVVCNFRLAITLRRLGGPLISFPDIAPDGNNSVLGDRDDQPLPTNSLRTDLARQRVLTSPLDLPPPESRRPSGDAS